MKRMSCSITTTASPPSRMRRTSAVASAVSCGFIPAVGSSSSSTFGSAASARAISSRRWSPYGRLRASSSATLARPTQSSSSRARASVSRSSRW